MSVITITVVGTATAVEVRSVTETPAALSSGFRTHTFDLLNYGKTIDANSVPAVGQPPIAESVTIGASAHAIDLTAAVLARDSSGTVDLTGAKLIGYMIHARKANSGNVTWGPNATNGYGLFSGTNEVVLNPGDTLQWFTVGIASQKPAVSSSVKAIDIAGTQNDLVDYILFFDDS